MLSESNSHEVLLICSHHKRFLRQGETGQELQENHCSGVRAVLQTAQKSDFQKQMTVRRGDGKRGKKRHFEDKSLLKETCM